MPVFPCTCHFVQTKETCGGKRIEVELAGPWKAETISTSPSCHNCQNCLCGDATDQPEASWMAGTGLPQTHVQWNCLCSATHKQDRENRWHHLLNGFGIWSACPVRFLKNNNTCFYIFWNTGHQGMHDRCSFPQATLLSNFSSEIEFLTKAYTVSPFVFHFGTLVHLFSFNVTQDNYQMKLVNAVQGFQLCTKLPNKHNIGSNVKQKASGEYVSVIFSHCKTEGKLSCTGDTKPRHKDVDDFYKFSFINDTNITCPSLYLLNSYKKCSKYDKLPSEHSSVVQSQHKSVDSHIFQCTDGSELDFAMVDDLVPDCGPAAEDETFLIAHLIFNHKYKCNDTNQIPCHPGHPKCFEISDLCLFRTDQRNQVIPCRNGKHLQNCKIFDCDKTYKCAGYYCIPWEYVCNGRLDCPKGSDEVQKSCLYVQQCVGLYKCQGGQQTCVHIRTVCDKVPNCPEEDDEKICELNTIHCPAHCHCLVFAMECTNTTVYLVMSNYPYIFVHLKNVTPNNVDHVWQFLLAVHLVFRNLQLTELCAVVKGQYLLQLTVNENSFETLTSHCFKNTPSISTLDIKVNKISVLKGKALIDLTNLRHLDLSQNRLENLPADSFPLIICTVILSQNPLNNLDFTFFSQLSIGHVTTESFKICCIAPPQTKCCSHRPWYLSCDQLLSSSNLQITFLSISSLIAVLNKSSILLHLYSRKRNMQNAIMIVSLAIADTLHCVFLYMISIPAMVFEKRFPLLQDKWRSSFTCHSSSGLLFAFHVTEPMCIALLSLLRLMVVKYPINTRFKRTYFCLKCIAVAYAIGFASLLVSTSVFLLFVVQLPPIICSPFLDPHLYFVFKTVTFVTAVIQIGVCTFILVSFCVMCKELKKSQQLRKSGPIENYNGLKIQIVIMILSCSLCWWPANILHILFSFLAEYPMRVVPWVVVSVMSINSIINPLVLVITMSKTLYKEHKAGKSKIIVQKAMSLNVVKILPNWKSSKEEGHRLVDSNDEGFYFWFVWIFEQCPYSTL